VCSVELLSHAAHIADGWVLHGNGRTRTTPDLSLVDACVHGPQDLQSPSSEDAYQQELLSCSLALAILGTACRLPDLAGSEDMTDRIPALVKVCLGRGDMSWG
jgi:hypothetical protein